MSQKNNFLKQIIKLLNCSSFQVVILRLSVLNSKVLFRKNFPKSSSLQVIKFLSIILRLCLCKLPKKFFFLIFQKNFHHLINSMQKNTEFQYHIRFLIHHKMLRQNSNLFSLFLIYMSVLAQYIYYILVFQYKLQYLFSNQVYFFLLLPQNLNNLVQLFYVL